MNFSVTVFGLVMLSSMAVFGNTTGALQYVPGGTIIQEKSNEVKVQTPAGTIVEVELKRSGSFDEASGGSAEKDVLIPGDGLLPLNEAVAHLKAAGKTPIGKWSLDKSFWKGWRYEFEGVENGQAFEYILDAKTGKLLEAKLDD